MTEPVHKLTRGQQEVLDALNFMDEEQLLPASGSAVARYMKCANGLPDISGRLKKLIAVGLIVKDPAGKVYSLAPDPGDPEGGA